LLTGDPACLKLREAKRQIKLKEVKKKKK